jgi:Flp pilus assembly pilin Flp
LNRAIEAFAARLRLEGGDCDVTSFLQDSLAPTSARLRVDEGQTMTEYAVVLGVITLLVVGAISALSGGIINAINSATSFL